MSNEQSKSVFINIDYNTVSLRTWMEFDGVKFIGMCSITTLDKDGKIVDHKIEPTGLIATYK